MRRSAVPSFFDEYLFPRDDRPRRWWERSGLTERQERVLNVLLVAIVAVLVGGWGYGIRIAVEEEGSPAFAGRLTASPLSSTAPPAAAFLLDEALRRFIPIDTADWRGESGALRVRILDPGDTLALPDSLPPGVTAGLAPAGADAVGDSARAGGSPRAARAGSDPADATTAAAAGAAGTSPTEPEPGLWDIVLRARDAVQPVPGMRVLVPVPMSAKRGGRVGEYLIGEWPFEDGRARPGYETPRGLIRVEEDEVDVPVSEHFLLGDFLTKGQQDVWPKYIVLSSRLLDKLELTLQELEQMGHPVEDVGVISGFRTPHYNAHGGTTSGRGDLSRHMYGDATDFFIDNDGNFCMDDLTGDGEADLEDIRVMRQAAERVEREHPSLIGGIGVYPPVPGAHCGFIHIDTRGYRARW